MFSWQLNHSTITLSGAIDEHFAINMDAADAAKLKAINFKSVTNINSAGVKGLMAFLDFYADCRLTYEDCSPELIGAFGIVPVLLGTGDNIAFVASFYLPYRCFTCSKEGAFRVLAHEVKGTTEPVFPEHPCPKCKRAMEPDDHISDCVGSLLELKAFSK